MSEAGAAPARNAVTRRRRYWLLGAGLLLLAGVAAWRALGSGDDTQLFTAKVQRGEIRDAVEATGVVNAVTTVQVGSQVSGTVARLNADFNSEVHKSDVIALIDPQLFQGALEQATADLANAEASVLVAEANLSKAESARVQTKADFDRAAAMLESSVGTPQAVDLAKANFESAKASVAAASASIAQAKAQVRQREAAVAVARTNLDYTVIRSPIDGIVVARNVDVGQTVAASLQAPTIFTIAQDLTQMQVYAKVDESDVGRMRMHQTVTFKVDAFPKELFRGEVTQVRMNPTTVQNVVTYDAIIDFANPERKLFPGMTAYVTIPVATAANVVKIPNAALRFKPPFSPEAVRALYAKYGIEEEKPAETASGESAAGAGEAAAVRHAVRAETAVVWKRHSDGSLEPVKISLGITDHTFTEVASLVVGRLEPGDDVVTGSTVSKSLPPGTQGLRR